MVDAKISLRHDHSSHFRSLLYHYHIIGANVARTFDNEDTCIYSTLNTACSATRVLDETIIVMNETNILKFFEFGNKYVYAINGLAMEDLDEHACLYSKSRFEVEPNTNCSSPTPNLNIQTITALESAFSSSTESNVFLKDIDGPLDCNAVDVSAETLGLQIQFGEDCYTHVHKDHKNVYDFSGWVRINICLAA